jgi:branched-chain amino acid transport system ATP-binding protein
VLGDSALLALPPHQRAHLGVGYMPEDRKLVPDLSCLDNLRIPLNAGVPVAAARIDRICTLVPELIPLLPRRASLLSGGQQKIVALARAYVVGTRLLLLDEPTEGVAPVLAGRFAEILAALKATGVTVLVAESDSRYVRHLVDRVYELDRGEATQAAPATAA